jgi:DNA polymerase III epsilon subunit-like protein
MLWKKATWMIIDVETTGFSPVNDRIVELGACKFIEGKAGERMGELINPGRPIPWRASEVHKITDAMVEGKLTLKEVAERFLPHVAAADMIAGYNFAFDHRMLRAELGSAWLDAIADKPVIDIYRWAKTAFPAGQRKLTQLCEFHQIAPPEGANPHFASTDCWMYGQLLWKLAPNFPDEFNESHPWWLRLER